MSVRELAFVAFAALAPETGELTADPLENLIEEPIDIELQGAPVRDVFLLIEDVASVDIVLDECVGGTIDLKLEHVTVRTLLEAVGAALDLEYRATQDDEIGVGCSRGHEDHFSAVRYDVEVIELVEEVMPSARVNGCDGRRIDLDVRNASRQAVLSAVAGELGAALLTEDGRTSLRCS